VSMHLISSLSFNHYTRQVVQNDLPHTAPIWEEKVAEWENVPYPSQYVRGGREGGREGGDTWQEQRVSNA